MKLGSPELIRSLERIGANRQIVEHFCSCVTDRDVDLATGGVLYSEQKLICSDECERRIIASGYLPIGAAPNGDSICVHLGNCELGFVSHELLPDEVNYTFVAPSLAAFLTKLQEAVAAGGIPPN